MSLLKIVLPPLTREIRANNLLGVSTCKFTHQFGQVGEDNEKGDHLAIMPDLEKGNYAAIALLTAKYLFCGWFVPFLLGNKWAGDLKQEYGKELSKIMGVGFRPFYFPLMGDSLMRAMTIMENGNPCRHIPENYFGQFINE